MPEPKFEAVKATGMCPHANFVLTCPICKNESEIADLRVIDGIISDKIQEQDFRKNIAPVDTERLSVDAFKKALTTLLDADIALSRQDRVRLFRQTLETYSRPLNAERLVWHSTSSYALRKSLEDGLSGGHGNFSGEAGAIGGDRREIQKGLSVTHPDHPSAESFQQMFARLSARRDELPGFLAVDSEVLTGTTLPEVFIRELLKSPNKEDMKKMLAKAKNIGVDEIDDALLSEATGSAAQQAFIDDFARRQYAPNANKIKKDVLPYVQDEALRAELESEAEHPFPCFITLGVDKKEKDFTTVSRGENPTHIPFEDFYWGTFQIENIREIRVPAKEIRKVQGWLERKGAGNIQVVPIEIYEVKRLIQAAMV